MCELRTWRTAAFAAVLAVAFFIPAAAQGPGGPPGRGGTGDRGPGRGDPVVDEEMRAALEQVMMVRLKRSLELTPDQEKRVMPRVEKLQAARRDFAARRRVAVGHLRALMLDPTARPADLEQALREVRQLEASFRDQQEALRADVNAELDPRQQARLYFFEERFRREMRRRLHEAAGARRGPEGGRGAWQGAGGQPPQEPEPDTGDEGDL